MDKKISSTIFTGAGLLLATFMTVSPALAVDNSEAAAVPHDHISAAQKKEAPVITVSIVSNIYGVGTLQTLNFNSDRELRTYLKTGLDSAHVENLHASVGANIPAYPETNYSPELQHPVTRSGYAHFEIDGNFSEGDTAKFAGWDISGVDLTGTKIRNMEFTGVNAAGTVFDRADIDNTMLSGIHAPDSSWKNVTFGDLVKASGCIEGVVTDFSRADFTGTPFRSMNWGRAIMDGATLPRIIEGTNLEGASLKGVNGYRTAFTGSYLAFTHIEGANLAGSTFDDMGLIMDVFFDKDTNLSGVRYTGNSIAAPELVRHQQKQEGVLTAPAP